LPIVQSGATVKVANNDLRPKQIQSNATSGVLQIAGPTASTTRVMTTPDANFTAARTDAAQTFTGNQTIVGAAGTDVVAETISTYGPVTQPAGTLLAYYQLKGPAAGNYSTDDAWDWKIARVAASGGGGANSRLSIVSTVKSVQTDFEVFYFNSVNNLVPALAGKGIDFSANTPAAGMTSQLLNWYEEGAWTPNQGGGLTLVGAFSSTGKYTRVGRNVTVSGTVTGATSVAVTAAGVITSNLPFTAGTAGHGSATNAANTAFASVICTTTNVTSAGAIAATATITFSATYFI
jgi:hypothetical protein